MSRYLIIIATILYFSSCSRQAQLFQHQTDQVLNDSLAQQMLSSNEPVLMPGDKISVSIWGHNDLSVASVNSVFSANKESGKWLLLDDEGKANLPKIGRVKLSGLTIKEANYALEQYYSDRLRDPIINIKVLNHFVTVLGEVKNPGRYQLDNEVMTLVQVLGQANGLTKYAKNEAIEVVRVIDGQSIKLTVDLTDLSSLPTKNITLRPNDIVHVGASRNKDAERSLGRASLVTSILTGIAVIISVFSK